MLSQLALLKDSGLLPISDLIEQRDRRHENEHLLSKIVGFITEHQTRPSTLTMLEHQRLPQPKELNICSNSEEFPNYQSFAKKEGMVKVTAFIWRSTLDDMYLFHLHATRTFYLIIRGMEGCKRLNREMATLVNQLAIGPEFPKYLWSNTKLTRVPSHVLRRKASCRFYGETWSVEVTFCPDQVVRITGWTGISVKVDWDTGKEFVITKGSPPLLLTPSRTKHAFSTEIEELDGF